MARIIENGQTYTKTIKFTSRYNSSSNVVVDFIYGDGLEYTSHTVSTGIFDGNQWIIGNLAANQQITMELQVTIIDYTQLLRVSWTGSVDIDALLTNNTGTWDITYDFACEDFADCIPEAQLLSYEISTKTLSITQGNSVQIPNTEYRLNLDGHQIQLTDIVGAIISFVDLPDEAFDTYTISINGNYLRLIKNGTTIVSDIMMPTYTLSGAGSTVYLTNNLTGAVSSYAVPSSGGADGSITLVELDGTDLEFTGINGGFNGTVDLSSLAVDTNTTYTLQLSGNNLQLVNNSAVVVSTIPLPVDTNTTYTLSRSGLTVSLTPSSGPVQNITLPDISITDTQPTGKTIATVTKLAGTTNTIKETITSIVYDINGNPSYVDEEGNETPITVPTTSVSQLDLMHSETLDIQIKHLMGDNILDATARFVVPFYIADYDTNFPGEKYWLREWSAVATNLYGIDAGGNVVLKLRHLDGTAMGVECATGEDIVTITTENVRYYSEPFVLLKPEAGTYNGVPLPGFLIEILSDSGSRLTENSTIHVTLYYEKSYLL